MAASDDLEIKAAILKGMERKLRSMLLQEGIHFPSPLTRLGPNGMAGLAFEAPDGQQFATGYDGTSTTMAFTTDVSIVTDGSSGDIVTG
jgi:hypothetical protein